MLLLIAAVLLILLMSMTTYEHMTNKDLMSALKKYGTHDEKDKKDKDSPSEAPIYGPTAKQPPKEPSPTKPSGKQPNTDSSNYPEIYGPDVVAVPGEKLKASDDEDYDYNPDLAKAFPTTGPPQPFLTDFSKFQH